MPTTYQDAQKKARYGHRDWVAYKGKDGALVFAPRSAAVIKAAMLAVGTRGRFTILAASTGIGHTMNWSIGCIMLRNARVGC